MYSLDVHVVRQSLRQQGPGWVVVSQCVGTPKSVYAQHPT